ncbi:MAG: LysR substrate-binding domain-containing protein [Nitrospirota bacterium]|nr:LysR substrate-binding domain-containing protein [Nitrospirota bacterium]
MTNDQLRVFLKVAEYQSFTQAGEALFLTQPAVSLQIKTLEKDLGVPLFERTGKKILLTEAGRRLVPLAHSITRQMDEARETVLSFATGPQGHLRIGASMTIGTYLLPKFLTLFCKIHPQITVSLAIRNTHQILHDLKTSEIDLGLIEGEPTRTQGLSLERSFLQHDRLLLIDSVNHPMIMGEGPVSLSDLSKFPVIGRESGSGTRQMLEEALLQLGLPPDLFNVTMIVDNPEAIKELVSLGAGISFLSALAVRPEDKGRIRTLPVLEFHPVRDLWILTPHRKLSSAADLFLGGILQATREPLS